MDRRLPFDPIGGGRPTQINNSAQQLRAALGLDDFYLQQQQQHGQQQNSVSHQQQQQQQQHDAQIRLRLLQEQQLVRARGESFHDYPSEQLQRLHRTMLINDHLVAQQQQQAILRAEQATIAHVEEQIRLRRQQQQLLGASFHSDELSQSASSMLDVSQLERFPSVHPLDASIETNLHGEHQRHLQREQLIQQQREEQVRAFLSTYQTVNESVAEQTQQVDSQEPQRSLSRNSNISAKNESQDNDSSTSPSNVPPSDSSDESPSRTRKKRRLKSDNHDTTESGTESEFNSPHNHARPIGSESLEGETIEHTVVVSTPKLPPLPFVNDRESSQRANDQDGEQTKDELDYSARSIRSLRGREWNGKEVVDYGNETENEEQHNEIFIVEGLDPELENELLVSKGSILDLLQVSEDIDVVDEAANVLVSTISKAELMPESDIESDDDNDVAQNGEETVQMRKDFKVDISFPIGSPDPSTTFTCRICQLPEEPILTDELFAPWENGSAFNKRNRSLEKDQLGYDSTHSKSKTKKNPVLEYPYPIDTWWPSVSGLKKELRNSGEASDEDAFEETQSENGEKTRFRANEAKIRRRFTNSLEPGVMEKLPHCMIHRVRTRLKKNSTAPELVYCWQVTELYPNDIMVNCSKCGTWRHAACGGHHRPYSRRENCYKPFVAICDLCSEEERFIRQYPAGERRLERQRTEQLRRALATSAVMRHASISKHSGTYKWPLGSVSATHIGGHIRSVHARHDKAEKQWTEMANRLGRGYGYRVKERIRSRTKEFERLLVSIEDAESYTDRHNMLLFLQRDTVREKPAGLEKPFGIIFDPADDDLFESSQKSSDDSDDDDDEDDNDDGENGKCVTRRHYWDGLVGGKKKKNSKNGEKHSQMDDGYGNGIDIATPSKKDIDEPYLLSIESDLQDNDALCVGSNSNCCIGTTSTKRLEGCVRIGCTKRRRFDSQFCSDACGISCLEQDLLRTLEDAMGIHPSVLRL